MSAHPIPANAPGVVTAETGSRILAVLAAILLAMPAASQVVETADRVLVGVHYFAGWWEPLPNKWHDPIDGHDWRTDHPGRVPLLGEFITQATMDKEIAAAADHGVDFFSILWYPIPPEREPEKKVRLVNNGLAFFLSSPQAKRLKFMVEFCNHPPFSVKTDEDWARCIEALLPAFKHPSYLRVGGKPVFKIHSAHHFALDNGNDPAREHAQLECLRGAVRKAGQGEMLIGAGIMGGTVVRGDWPAAKLFDFVNTYMDMPRLEAGPEDHPYARLAEAVRKWNAVQAQSAIPYVPFVAAGFNARPWRDNRPAFAFPTREEFASELRQVAADLAAHPCLGLPFPDAGRQKIFTIYAWNEYGEGGIVAPTRGDGWSRLQAVREVFGSAPPASTMVESTPFTARSEGYVAHRCPTLAVSAKGTVLAFCEGRVNSHKDEDDMDVLLKRSSDGGHTWGPLQVLANDDRNPCKNQCPVVLPSGRILLVWLWNKWIPSENDRTTREVFVMHSDDDGLTWSEPRNITRQVYRDGWGWYGTGPCHGIVKRREPHKGRIVVPARHNAKGARMVSHVIYSDDDGETWHIGGNVPRPRTTEGTVVELSNGDLMLNSRNQNDDEDYRVVSVSRDGGETFPETWLETQLVEPRGCQASLLFHSLNPATGKGNILFSNPANREVRSDGTLKLSDDDGRTWTRAFRYAKKPAPNFTGYSDLAVMPDGSVGILHECGELDDANKKSERYDEIGFIVVPFDEICTSLPPVPKGSSTP